MEAAAAEYEKAAVAFRVAQAMPRAIDAFSKAADMHEKFDSGYMAAKHMETAAFLAGAGGLKEPLQSAELYERAASHDDDEKSPGFLSPPDRSLDHRRWLSTAVPADTRLFSLPAGSLCFIGPPKCARLLLSA